MITTLKKKAVKNRVFRVSDFRKFFQTASDLIVEKDCVYDGFGFVTKSIYLISYVAKQIFVSCDRTFIYCENYSMYENKNNKIVSIYNLSKDHIHIGEITQNATKKVFIVGEFGAKFLGGVTVKNFPLTKNIVIDNQQVYTEYDGKISFFTPYDFINQHADLTEVNTIQVTPATEKVLGMFKKDKNIYLICKNSIYKVSLDDELYKSRVERLEINDLDINEKSLAIGKNYCSFISGENLCVFDGQIKRYSNLILLENEYTSFNTAFNYNNIYFFPITDKGGVNYCYFYNFANQKQGFLGKVTCASENGLFIENKYIKEIDFTAKSSNQKIFISKDIDFSSSEIKTLNSLEVEVLSKTILQIEGDFGLKKITLFPGYNKIDVNLQSTFFKLKFTCNGEFKMQNLNLLYRYRGE